MHWGLSSGRFFLSPPTPPPPATPATTTLTLRNPPHTAPDACPFRCLLDPCPHYPASYQTRRQLAAHLTTHHRTSLSIIIPDSALSPHQLIPCPHCTGIFTSPAYLALHIRKKHHVPTSPPHPTAAATPAAQNPNPAATPPPPVHAPPSTDYYTPNTLFFQNLPPDSPLLHEVHNLAIDSLPHHSIPIIDSILGSFLTHLLTDLDQDGPVTAVYALPRLLLSPPPSDAIRCDLPSLLRTRAELLRCGRAHELWAAFDWAAATPSPTDFPTTTPATSSARITRASVSQSPATAFRSIADPPYLPPTRTTADLLLTLFPRAPNPHLTQLADEADRLLPSAPLGSGISSMTPPPVRPPSPLGAATSPATLQATRTAPASVVACSSPAPTPSPSPPSGWTPSYTPATPQPIAVSSPPRH